MVGFQFLFGFHTGDAAAVLVYVLPNHYVYRQENVKKAYLMGKFCNSLKISDPGFTLGHLSAERRILLGGCPAKFERVLPTTPGVAPTSADDAGV
jgi:hypothetical protein